MELESLQALQNVIFLLIGICGFEIIRLLHKAESNSE